MEEDLLITDRIATAVTAQLRDDCSGTHATMVRQHYDDNHTWIKQAYDHNLVVGSQARILYSDAEVRAAVVAVGGGGYGHVCVGRAIGVPLEGGVAHSSADYVVVACWCVGCVGRRAAVTWP